MRIAAAGLELEVRPGTIEDVPLLISFIRAMAEFEKLEVTATEDVLRDTLFGTSPAAHTLLGFVEGRPAAYAVYFFTFSTMAGKPCLWLDDLFVDPAFRGKGIGRALLAYFADLAVKKGCARFEWIVLDWNEAAVKLYESLGAAVHDEWHVCRLEGEKLSALAERFAPLDDSD